MPFHARAAQSHATRIARELAADTDHYLNYVVIVCDEQENELTRVPAERASPLGIVERDQVPLDVAEKRGIAVPVRLRARSPAKTNVHPSLA